MLEGFPSLKLLMLISLSDNQRYPDTAFDVTPVVNISGIILTPRNLEMGLKFIVEIFQSDDGINTKYKDTILIDRSGSFLLP